MHNSRVSGNVIFSFTLKLKFFNKKLNQAFDNNFYSIKENQIDFVKTIINFKKKYLMPQCNATHSKCSVCIACVLSYD